VFMPLGASCQDGLGAKMYLNQFSAVELLYACKVNEKHIEHISVL
jgi:hypothetical protein